MYVCMYDCCSGAGVAKTSFCGLLRCFLSPVVVILGPGLLVVLGVGASLAGSWCTPFVLAVGGPTKGRLFLSRLVSSCSWSLSSSNEVGRLRAAVLCSMVRYFRSEEDRAYNWVGGSSLSEIAPEGRKGDTHLLSAFGS